MKWTEVAVKLEQELEELVTNRLYMLDIRGLDIEDPRQVEDLDNRRDQWDYIDENLIRKKMEALEDDRIVIKVYFSQEERPEEKIREIEEILRDIESESRPIEIYSSEIEDRDWSENWKKFYKPTRIGRNIVIKPSWETYTRQEGDIVVEMDPGMAFGTGTHETTSMCTEALEKYLKKGDQVYDIGTGSGILAMVAAKLGAGQVLGVDFDPTAVRVARENVSFNRLEDLVTIEEGDLFKMIQGRRDLIVANIMAEIIAGMAGDVVKYLRPGGIFISSGIITEKIGLVEGALVASGFEIIEIVKKNSWACIVAKL